METGSQGSAGPKSRRYRITVRGEVSQRFVESLGHVSVESAGDESILDCEIVDQARLETVLAWLYERGIEIVRSSGRLRGSVLGSTETRRSRSMTNPVTTLAASAARRAAVDLRLGGVGGC